MITDKNEYTVEFSATDMDQLDFKIKNPAIVFEILSTKLYDNPLLVVIQEYMCNARDAHRELGNIDVPIRIVLPTQLTSTLKIQDFGVGMSPERVKEIFVYLGESTKNSSDLYTGGFGVGAKSGWVYTDTFTVKTVYDNIEYVYLAYIGEEGIGKLDLVHTKNTDQCNGTTIEIDIKSSDFKLAEEYVYRTSYFWDVRPEIINSLYYFFKDDDRQSIYDKDGNLIGTLVKNGVNNIPYLANTNGQINIVIDGIIYNNINDFGSLPKNFNIEVNRYSSLFLHYGVSELRPSINRKSVMITKNTNATIYEKLIKLINILNEDVNVAINNAKTIPELFDIINEIKKSDRMFLINKWESYFNNYILNYNHSLGFHFKVPNVFFMVQLYEYEKYSGKLRYKTTQSSITAVQLNDKCVVLNDKYTKTFDKYAIKQYLIKNNLNHIIIIQPDLNTYDKEIIIENTLDFLSFIDGVSVKYSDLKKLYSANRSSYIPAKVVNSNTKNKVFNIIDILDDYDYIVMYWKPDVYYGTSPYNLVKKYNQLDDVKFIIVNASEASIRKIEKLPEYNDKFIDTGAMIDIMYDYLLTKININRCSSNITTDFDLDQPKMYAINTLRHRLASINDVSVRTLFSNILAFDNKYRKIKNTHNNKKDIAEDLASSIYRIKNKSHMQVAANYKTDMLNKLITRKTRIFEKELKTVFTKYPLLNTIYSSRNYSSPDNFIEYINIFHQCKKIQHNQGV